jgi:hypothetical protein
VSVFVKKTVLRTFLISIEKIFPVLKENKKSGFVDSEFVKTCHEYVIPRSPHPTRISFLSGTKLGNVHKLCPILVGGWGGQAKSDKIG